MGAPPHHTLVEPLAWVITLVQDGEEIAPGVVAVVTPGHSAGHTSYVVMTDAGKRLIAFGDIFHTPVQITHPEWSSISCWPPSRFVDEPNGSTSGVGA